MSRKPSTTVTQVTELERGAEPSKSLGERIRAFREYLGLDQKEFASLVGGVSDATVSRWESKGSRPKNKLFGRMLEIARDEGGLQKLLGADERDLMEEHFTASSEGVSMFLDFEVQEPENLGAVVADLVGLGAQLTRFTALGETEALLLLHLTKYAQIGAVKDYMRTSELVQDPHVSMKSTATFWSRGGTTRLVPRSLEEAYLRDKRVGKWDGDHVGYYLTRGKDEGQKSR